MWNRCLALFASAMCGISVAAVTGAYHTPAHAVAYTLFAVFCGFLAALAINGIK